MMSTNGEMVAELHLLCPRPGHLRWPVCGGARKQVRERFAEGFSDSQIKVSDDSRRMMVTYGKCWWMGCCRVVLVHFIGATSVEDEIAIHSC